MNTYTLSTKAPYVAPTRKTETRLETAVVRLAASHGLTVIRLIGGDFALVGAATLEQKAVILDKAAPLGIAVDGIRIQFYAASTGSVCEPFLTLAGEDLADTLYDAVEAYLIEHGRRFETGACRAIAARHGVRSGQLAWELRKAM